LRSAALLDRLQDGTHMEKEARQTSQYMEGRIRDSTRRRNLKDEGYFDRELWKKKKYYAFGLRKTVYSHKNYFNNINNNSIQFQLNSLFFMC
jgi:hypothetical protein